MPKKNCCTEFNLGKCTRYITDTTNSGSHCKCVKGHQALTLQYNTNTEDIQKVKIQRQFNFLKIFIKKKLSEKLLTHTFASHKSNPSSQPQGIVDSYSTLPCVMWETVTGLEGIPCWGFLQHMLVNRVLVYPSQGGRYRAEGCVALG